MLFFPRSIIPAVIIPVKQASFHKISLFVLPCLFDCIILLRVRVYWIIKIKSVMGNLQWCVLKQHIVWSISLRREKVSIAAITLP